MAVLDVVGMIDCNRMTNQHKMLESLVVHLKEVEVILMEEVIGKANNHLYIMWIAIVVESMVILNVIHILVM